jgi:hypothetical protein
MVRMKPDYRMAIRQALVRILYNLNIQNRLLKDVADSYGIVAYADLFERGLRRCDIVEDQCRQDA